MFLRKTHGVFIVFCIALLVSGCKTAVTNFRQSLSAPRAEAQADEAYAAGDYKRALSSFLEAAQAGRSYSQFMLASMYLNGQGTRVDNRAGKEWMRNAAANNYPPATYSLGLFNLFGFEAEPDMAAAADYFEQAARQEHGLSMVALGTMYAVGLGVERDRGEAVRWFRLARAHGFSIKDELLAKPERIFEIAFKNQAPQPIALSNMSSKAQLRQIQRQLDALGYNPGPIDGAMGPATREAIRVFQKEAGLPVDGQVTKQTIYVLNLTF
jgi:localization factor PodJL